ncbi:MAG: ATP-binding cassette domain-containing protein [Gemmatimonadetes bacterium]|nr:ATP-binding cassette domain-containing protein [Gemmatimonadota bacterium]
MSTPAPALALRDVSKRFGAVQALDRSSITVRAGTVHALLGENGAGKSTLMRIAFGLARPDDGEIQVRGTRCAFASAADAGAAGLGMVHQHFMLVPALTVAENVALGGRGRFAAAAVAERIRAIGEETGLRLEPDAEAGTLPVSAQQRLEIVKALARGASVLILDEPTAVLAPTEARELLAWVRRWATGERAAVLITHHLDEALAVADDVTVLRRGVTVLARPVAAVPRQAIIGGMLGEGELHAGAAPLVHLEEPARGAPLVPPGAAAPAGRRPVLSIHEASVVDARGVVRLAGATCEIAGGEIVGVAAIEGSGQAELLRLLSGRLAPTSGTVSIPDEVAFVPADRQRDALVLDFTLVENMALRGAGAARGRVPWKAMANETALALEQFDIRGAGRQAPARSLSGGNQQKFVLARELSGAPAALVAENPTRGLDIRATADVLARVRAARSAGLAVVVYSEDLDEVLALADRVLVVHQGRVRAMAPDREAVGRAMLGAQ